MSTRGWVRSHGWDAADAALALGLAVTALHEVSVGSPITGTSPTTRGLIWSCSR